MSITTSSLVRISSFFIVHPISLWYPQCILLPVGCAHFPTFFFPKPGTWRDAGDMNQIIGISLKWWLLMGGPKIPNCFTLISAHPQVSQVVHELCHLILNALSPLLASHRCEVWHGTRNGLVEMAIGGFHPNFWLYTHGDSYIKGSNKINRQPKPKSFLRPTWPTSLMMDNSL